MADLNEKITLRRLSRMSDKDIEDFLFSIRWPSTSGMPVCPRCTSERKIYRLEARRVFKCGCCGHQFSVTSGTAFSSLKMSLRDYVLLAALFIENAKGISALQVSKTMGLQYKSAFVFNHKLRELLVDTGGPLKGVVEIDGCVIGGYRLAENHAAGKFEKRRYYAKFDNRRVVIAAHERMGRVRTWVAMKESDATVLVKDALDPSAIISVDAARAWNGLMELFESLVVNHSMSYSSNNACTNNAESFFSRLRKMQYGTHHKIGAKYLHLYAQELCWRHNNRHLTTDEKIRLVLSLAMSSGESSWTGYMSKPNYLNQMVAA